MKIEINTFIENAITEILQGVESAHNYIKENQGKNKYKGALNPHFVNDGDHSRKELIRDINFDVAINIETTREKSGGAKAKIYIVDAGGEYKKNDTTGQLSRVQFSVPMLFPMTQIKDRQIEGSN